MLNLIERDSYLEPYTLEIDGRYRYFLQKEKELTKNGRQTLSSFASGYLYFGLHRTSTGWCFREWAPNAKKIVLIGDFSNWEERPEFELKALPGGVWERRLPRKALVHGQHYKMKVYWDGGCGAPRRSISSRIQSLSQKQRLCSSTSATLVWHKRRRRLVHIKSSRRKSCPA